MERAFRAMIEKHRPQKQDGDTPKQRKREYLKEVGDFVLQHLQDTDTDNTFDNDEMRACVTSFKVFCFVVFVFPSW